MKVPRPIDKHPAHLEIAVEMEVAGQIETPRDHGDVLDAPFIPPPPRKLDWVTLPPEGAEKPTLVVRKKDGTVVLSEPMPLVCAGPGDCQSSSTESEGTESSTIETIETIEPGADSRTPLDWRRAHEALSRLAVAKGALDWEEGRWLLYALRSGAHLHLGHGSFAEYVERIFGYKPRFTGERLRVAEALEELPELAQTLRDGSLSWSAVRELVRVATRENETDWIAAAENRSVREIEQLVSGHRPGDRPGDPVTEGALRHVLRFEVSGDVLATWREAMAKVRRDVDGPLDDSGILLLIARQILGGPANAGRSNYQIALTVCGDCGRGWQQGRGELVAVGSQVVEMAECDAQHIGSVATDALEHTHVRQDHTHVGSDGNGSKPVTRAQQDIPPRMRRQVMRRDAGRCVVPGCRQSTFVDAHHINLRSEGGRHDPDNIIVLCCAHHAATHHGSLVIEGRVSTGLTFRHADGSVYGKRVSPTAVDACEKAFSALRGMGFREGEARRAVERVRAQAHVGNLSDLLKAALATLR